MTSPKTTASRPLDRFQLLLLLALVLQNTATVLVGRYTRTAKADKEDLYDLNQFFFVSECVKLGLSFLLEYYMYDGQSPRASIFSQLLEHPAETMKMAVPAATYLASNTLLYVALSNLTVPIYQIVYQGKLVVTALVSVAMLKRQYSLQQWLCLLVISFGVAVIAAEGNGGGNVNSEDSNMNMVVGLSALSISCLLSSFASVYFEKIVKSGSEKSATTQPSLWMRNIQLSFFSIVFAAGKVCYTRISTPASNKHLFHGFDGWVWLQVALFGVGGLLVAGVIKYADNVLKGMATAMSIVLATICSVFVFDTMLTERFLIGAIMVLPSVYIYSIPCNTSDSQKNRSLEMLSLVRTSRVHRPFNLALVLFVALSLFHLKLGAYHPLDYAPSTPHFGGDCRGDVALTNSSGMHSLRQDLPMEKRPSGITDIEWVLSKQFSDIEDAELLLQWEKSRPEEEQNILTFVMSVTGLYDQGPIDVSSMPLANHSKVRFLFLSDDLEYVVPSPWKHVKVNYPMMDDRVDLNRRNSLSRLIHYVNDTENPRRNHHANMYSKYFCHLWWRIPELRKSRYVAYLGGGVNIQKIPVEFYDKFLGIMSEGYHRFQMTNGINGKNMLREAEVASRQQRYLIDNVKAQAEFYASNWHVPANDSGILPIFWLALSFYDNYHVATRQVLFDTWAECQFWSLEDQISYPFSLWVNGEMNTTKIITPIESYFRDYLGLTPNDTLRFPHKTSHYGK